MPARNVFLHVLSALFFFCAALSVSEAKSGIGKIIQMTGDVDITDMNSRMRIVPEIGTRIREDQKIRTGSKAYLEILLDDNTKIFMRELSVIEISGLRIKSDDPPEKINISTGKIRINTSRQISGRSLILKTETAIIGIDDSETDIAVITTGYETKAVVFEGQAEIASSSPDIIKSYYLKKREESAFNLNSAPAEPVVVPQEILDYWLDYYEIDGRRIIVKGKEDRGIIDFILRKRKF